MYRTVAALFENKIIKAIRVYAHIEYRYMITLMISVMYIGF